MNCNHRRSNYVNNHRRSDVVNHHRKIRLLDHRRSSKVRLWHLLRMKKQKQNKILLNVQEIEKKRKCKVHGMEASSSKSDYDTA